jgi:hypothetical protein
METALGKMKAQLKLWSSQIDGLSAKTQMPGGRAGFDDLMHVDELKALHALAQSRFDQFRAAGDAERESLETEMQSAWNELDGAFKTGSHRRKR